jgi:transcriptional regulator with XRE-family HTH domain
MTKPTVLKIGAVKPLFSAPYSHTGVQQLITWIMDSQGIGQFELSKRSRLSPAAIYQILNKSENEVSRPPRRSTVSALAQAIGARVHFDSEKNMFALFQQFDLPKTDAKQLSLLLSEIGSWIISRRKLVTKEERERIVRVVKASVG